MPRKISDTLINNAISMITNGSTIKAAANEIGVSHAFLGQKLKQLGVPVQRNYTQPEKVDLPNDQICSMYSNGESENAIAKHFGVSRNAIRSRLIKAGITPRTQSEAESLKWAKMTDEQRANQVKAAHIATTGCVKSFDTKCKIAVARQNRKYKHLIGVGETEFIKLLNDRQIDFTHQKAVGSYNLDFAIGNVAVELTTDTGRYFMNNPKERQRSEYLLHCGYNVVAVSFDDVRTLINCADDVIALINEVGSLKAVSRHYWVIGCRRQDYAIVKNERKQFTSVPAPEQFITRRAIIEF